MAYINKEVYDRYSIFREYIFSKIQFQGLVSKASNNGLIQFHESSDFHSC